MIPATKEIMTITFIIIGCGLDNFYDGGDDADEVLEKAAWLDSLSNGWLHTNLFQDFWSPPASAPTATPTRRTF